MSDTDSRFIIDRALLERIVSSERIFREEVVASLAELKVTTRHIQDSFAAHVKEDSQKFGDVNVKLGENSGKVQYMLGGAAAAIVVIGLALAIARLLV